MRPLDGLAVQLGEWDEGHGPAVVDIGALDGDLTARRGLLDDLEDTLRPRRPDGITMIPSDLSCCSSGGGM